MKGMERKLSKQKVNASLADVAAIVRQSFMHIPTLQLNFSGKDNKWSNKQDANTGVHFSNYL